MEDIDPSPTQSPASKKRAAPHDDHPSPERKPLNLKGTQFIMPTPPDTDHSSNVSISANNEDNSRHASPAPSSSALSSVEVIDDEAEAGHSKDTLASGAAPTTSGTSGQPPAKRRKLTPSEKQQKQQEKEAKAAEKAQKKAQKEEEKKAKDEEKRLKAEEQAEKKRVKDEEKRHKAEERDARKREKEMEEERKSQEKLKKERSQMRLGVFFQKPPTPVKQDESGGTTTGSARRKSLSLEPFDAVADDIRRSQSPAKRTPSISKKTQPPVQNVPAQPAKAAVSDYDKYFLPFQLPTNSIIAQDLIPQTTESDQDSFDSQLNDASMREKYDLGLAESYVSLEQLFADERRGTRGIPTAPVRKLMEEIQGSQHQPIDLTNESRPSNPMDDLQRVSRRYLEFFEDVRPAYFGTYSKEFSPRTKRKLTRNPYTRARKDTDYDYDSEAEWEEPEEGEDLLDEDEDEADSQGDANEMDEFLDDEDDALKNKRKQITGDLVPASTGLCWEDSSGKVLPSIEAASAAPSMQGMRVGFLLPGFTGATIDPFSTAYWQSELAKDGKTAPAVQPSVDPANGMLAPPRPPLQPRPSANGTLDHMLVGAAQGERGPITSVASTQGSKPGRKPAPKTLSAEDMAEFKDAVVNSPLSKADLLKGLKARFPKMTNEVIKSTLGEHFAQMGASKAEKKWIFVSAS